MDTSLGLLKEKGFKKITLEAGINNKAAHKLYKSKGFAVDKILRNYYKSGEDALHFVRML
jgi:ribosomal protein S18 acetylase RimI-like enzyme